MIQNISESLRKQRELILDECSEQALDRHTSLLEIAIISIYNRLANRLTGNSEAFRAAGAILALGTFGRGVSGPVQPVPILCLHAEESSFRDSWIDEITAPLGEAGWTVEALQGTVEQIADMARDNGALLQDLLDLRYISGNRALAEQLDKAVDAHVEKNREQLLRSLFESVKSRQKVLDKAQGWLEPDIEQNPGGLSEISAIRAGCRIASNIRSLEDAIFQGYLLRQEVDFLLQAEKSLSRYLTLLRVASGRPDGVLLARDQENIAKKLGYLERSGFLPVEIFMQHVHQLFHGVAEVSREFWEKLCETRAARSDERGVDVEDGVVARSGKLHIQTERYPASAGHLVHLFALAAARGLGLANVTRQWISHNRNVLDSAAGDPAVKYELFELLRADTPELTILRRFYDLGLLTALVPELASVHGLVQHDAFHLYPVHEHHLRTCAELKKLLAGRYARVEPGLTQVAAEIADPALLLLAGLLHDLGKSSGAKHALRGGEMIPAVARRLGLPPRETETVQFLVSQHLLLIDSASMRDLADQEMIGNCTTAIGKKEYLDQLVLLTFADMMSTGPHGREKWRDTPVMLLYRSIANVLEKGEPSTQIIADRISRVRSMVEERVSDIMLPAELETYFSQLAPRYLISLSPEEIVRHLRLGRRLRTSTEPFVWEAVSGKETAEITIMSWDKAGLLARSAGILTLHGLNITSAQVFTMNDEIALLIFQCRLPERMGAAMDWEAVRNDMDRLLKGKLALDYRIAAHSERRGRPRKVLRSAPSQIIIDNGSSAVYTILEVYTVDRIGLLYTISRTLHELQIRIYVAKITTKNDQVADVFYIRTDKREKVTDPEQTEEIKKALRFCLDGKAEWD
ncbi:MAG: HD domain-containing protein [Syntrophobacteraceae bacterium]